MNTEERKRNRTNSEFAAEQRMPSHRSARPARRTINQVDPASVHWRSSSENQASVHAAEPVRRAAESREAISFRDMSRNPQAEGSEQRTRGTRTSGRRPAAGRYTEQRRAETAAVPAAENAAEAVQTEAITETSVPVSEPAAAAAQTAWTAGAAMATEAVSESARNPEENMVQTAEAVESTEQNPVQEAVAAENMTPDPVLEVQTAEAVVDNGTQESGTAENTVDTAAQENAAAEGEAAAQETDEAEGAADAAAKEADEADSRTETPDADKTKAAVKKPKTAKKKSWIRTHLPQFLLILFAALLIIVLAVLIIRAASGASDNARYMDQIRNQEIKVNDVGMIDDLFNNYYTALASGNTTDLERLYDDPSKANITTEISTIVDNYDNLQIYTTPGIEDNTIVAFVYNDMHFANIDATAPSVDSFYLRYNPDTGSLKICSDMYTDPEILKYMNLVSYREPIRTLLSDTDAKLEEALASNKDLNNLYIIMQSMTEAAAVQPEGGTAAGTDAGSQETPAETAEAED